MGGEGLNRFEERNPRLWAFLEQISLLVISSLAALLFSLPIITAPAALAGLFGSAGGLLRPSGPEGLVRFWRTFRRSLVPATLLGLIDLAVGLLLWFDIRFFLSIGGLLGLTLAALSAFIALFVLLMNVYLWPLLAWYPQPLGKLLRRSFLLAAAHPLWALAGVLGALAVLVLLWSLPGPVKGLTLAIGPAGAALAVAAAAWRAMERYAGPDDTFAE